MAGLGVIVSHKHRFIFLKTHKTASTSLEIALTKVCGDGDVITPFPNSPADEFIRSQESQRGPQNYELPLRNYSLLNWLQLVRHQKRLVRFWNHMPARLVRRLVGRAIWDSYFKFCFERNPWDKAVSSYFFHTRSRTPPPSFSEYILEGRAYRSSDFDLYSIRGLVAVDQVYRFEDLGQAVGDIERRLSLPNPLRLPHAKSQYRTHPGFYAELYGERERELVARTFAREIAHFGYSF